MSKSTDESKMILFVDDDRVYLKYLIHKFKEVLGNAYEYEKANSAEDAHEVISDEIATSGNLPALMLVDWMMPGKRGDKLLIEVNQLYPEISLILHSGLADEKTHEMIAQKSDILCSLRKPWDGKEHLDLIKKQLDS